jgi:GGDEF domain-containing protein
MFRAAVREDDLVARFGAEAFLMVLDDVDRAEAEAIARKIEGAVADEDAGLFHPGMGALRVGVSIGVGCFPQDGPDYAGLLSVADANMRRRKGERKLRQLAVREPGAGVKRGEDEEEEWMQKVRALMGEQDSYRKHLLRQLLDLPEQPPGGKLEVSPDPL